MSSEFPGDFFTPAGRSNNFRSPLSSLIPDPTAQIRRNNLFGKRSLAEFQQSQIMNNHDQGFYSRNFKSRHFNYQNTPPTFDFSPDCVNLRYGVPILTQPSLNLYNPSSTEKKIINNRLQELENELLKDDEDEEDVSIITNNSEWSNDQTIRNLIEPNQKPIISNTSPTSSSSSSSCCSTSASQTIISSPKQSLIDAATAISDGKYTDASEILTRLDQLANSKGSSEQRLTSYMISALKSRVSPKEHPMLVSELYTKEHAKATQMLYEVSPCFKLGFMAANFAILDAASEKGFRKIHVVDFDIGHGGQYVHLLHALAAKKLEESVVLKITTFTDYVSGGEERLTVVQQYLERLASKLGVLLTFCVKSTSFVDLNREKLEIEADEALAVNFAFKLHKLPDESVTTENLRDELLRRVKSLAPVIMTVVEQEMNANTTPLAIRVKEACEHYGALFDALEATVVSRENVDRVRIEEAMGRKMGNSIAWEGRDRVERCEVFGKWRARMGMAGFKPVPMGQPVADSLRVKLNSGTRGNPGFSVNAESGGICCGWMGRTLTVASAWR